MALRVDMTGNQTGFQRMLETAQIQTKAFGASMSENISRSFISGIKGMAGAFIGFEAFDKLKETFSWFTETGTQIKDISDQLGMSTDQWQKWSDAVGQAGLQTEGFVRVIEALKEERIEAMTDQKARAALMQLGFTDADISGGMSTSDFVQKALQNANTNQWAAKAFNTIVGTQGERYTRAVGYLPNAKADFSPGDLKDAQNLHDVEHTVQKGVVEPIKKGLVHLLLDKNFWKALISPMWDAAPAIAGSLLNQASEEANASKTPGPGPFVGPMNPANDPLNAVLQQQNQEFGLRDQERNQRVTDSDRELMTIGDRFKSIRQEMGPLKDQIAQREKAMKSPEGFLTDAQRQSLSGVTGIARTIQVNELRQKYQDDTAEMKMRLNKDTLDLKQGPVSFQADNLAKAGLYSASALRFNPVLGLEKTNQLLERIVTNTAKPTVLAPSDPHRR